MDKKFGFIGVGNMGGALATAVAKSDNTEIFASDFDTIKLKDIASKIGATATDNKAIADDCNFIVLGVKPQVIDKLLVEISPLLKSRKDRFIIVSMAAGISTEHISEVLENKYPIIRMMPNTPVFVEEGMILAATANGVTDDEFKAFCEALKNAGKVDRIDEKLIDAAGSLSGCGPAFVYMFAEGLADGAVECGVPRDKAMEYAYQTILGAAKMLIETKEHPAALKDKVCSPGGTTIAGVHTLEDGAFRSLCMDAVKSAYKRTLELK